MGPAVYCRQHPRIHRGYRGKPQSTQNVPLCRQRKREEGQQLVSDCRTSLVHAHTHTQTHTAQSPVYEDMSHLKCERSVVGFQVLDGLKTDFVNKAAVDVAHGDGPRTEVGDSSAVPRRLVPVAARNEAVSGRPDAKLTIGAVPGSTGPHHLIRIHPHRAVGDEDGSVSTHQ